MEVGCNLPPLKNDIIMEKKRELEEYRQFRRMKQKLREEKRHQKTKEKESKTQSQGLHRQGDDDGRSLGGSCGWDGMKQGDQQMTTSNPFELNPEQMHFGEASFNKGIDQAKSQGDAVTLGQEAQQQASQQVAPVTQQ